MPIELMVIKRGGMLYPYLEDDRVKLRNVRQDQGYRCTFVQQHDRSMRHHRKYWGGLLELMADYWDVPAGVVSPTEESVLSAYNRWLARKTGVREDTLQEAKDQFVTALKQRRGEQIGDVEQDHSRKKEIIHRWIKEQMGFYDLVPTPTGYDKKLKSINFQSMPDEASFLEFYRGAFDVAWKYILSQSFNSSEEAEAVINELSAMGN